MMEVMMAREWRSWIISYKKEEMLQVRMWSRGKMVEVRMQRRVKISEVVAAPFQIIMQAARCAIIEALLHSISATQRDASGN